MKNNKVKGKKILIAAVFTFFAVFGLIACGPSDKSIDNTLSQIAEEVNKGLPVMADMYTRMDKIETLPGKKIRYNNTLVDAEVESIDIDAFKDTADRALRATVKNNPSLESFRKRNVTFIYVYNDKAGNEVAVFEYTPQDYK